MQEKTQKYEKKMEAEIQSRVGDIIKQKEEMMLVVEETQNTFAEKEAVIERLKKLVEKKKGEYEKEQEEHAATKELLNKANYKIKQLEKKLQQAKQQTEEKLEEIDKLYSESDYLKGELNRIREKYDFDSIDKDKNRLFNLDAWAMKILNTAGKVTSIFESYFNCGLCNSLANQATIIEPCGHVFCKACFEN